MPYYIDQYDAKRRYYCEEQELLDIANKIRAAGGAEALEAFFPSFIGNEHKCLIANALNFGCAVTPVPYEALGPPDRRWESGSDKWVMEVPTVKLAKQLAAELGWSVIDHVGFRNLILLPELVGNTAQAFDERKGWTKKYAEFEPDVDA